MQIDQQAIQGLWRIVSDVSRGRSGASAGTHYQFVGDRMKEVVPSLADGGSWATFELGSGGVKRLTETYEFPARGGGTRLQIHRALYELDGDTLRICWPLMGNDFPTEFSDQTQRVVTLTRDPGPTPETKKRAGKQPATHPSLGRLVWDDSLDWWAGEVAFKKGVVIELYIDPGQRGDAAAIEGAAGFIRWLKKNDAEARRVAAAWLLETYNAFWNQGKRDIAPRTFAGRLTLDAVSIRADGGADLSYLDGGLFRGHAITVRVNEKHEFVRAQLSG